MSRQWTGRSEYLPAPPVSPPTPQTFHLPPTPAPQQVLNIMAYARVSVCVCVCSCFCEPTRVPERL